ncbi:MAG TPA: 30S ribosomal protein S16 [Candidatus Magasanikbacteria bacterium]|nr:30S ribosomal protein S16 [Candidatus Magasanikbacteria bacterium]
MLTIKLARFGKAKEPTFRLILIEKSKDPKNSYLENLGFYDARKKQSQLKSERINYWLSKGAQATTTVHNLLVEQKVIAATKLKKVKLTGRRKAKIAEKNKAKETKAA